MIINLTVFPIRIFFPREIGPRTVTFPLKGYSDITTDGLNCLRLSQKKKEIPTVSNLGFCNGIKLLRGCLIEKLLPFWQGGGASLRKGQYQIRNGKSSLKFEFTLSVKKNSV